MINDRDCAEYETDVRTRPPGTRSAGFNTPPEFLHARPPERSPRRFAENFRAVRPSLQKSVNLNRITSILQRVLDGVEVRHLRRRGLLAVPDAGFVDHKRRPRADAKPHEVGQDTVTFLPSSCSGRSKALFWATPPGEWVVDTDAVNLGVQFRIIVQL